MKAALQKYCWIPLSLLIAYAMFRSVYFPVHDFANYYFGGYFMAHQQFASNIYFPYFFNKQIVALGYDPMFAGFAPNSPFLALLFVPFSFLSLAVAKLVFNSISVLLFLYTIRRLVSFYKIDQRYIILAPILLLVPIKNDLLFGQVYLLLFFFLSESWMAYEKKQPVKTALLLSCAILLKVFPVLLLLIFVFRKQFRIFAYTIASCLLLVLLTVPFCGFDVWFFYITEVLPKASSGGIASAYVDNYQSVFMFLRRFLVFNSSQNDSAVFSQPILFTALMLAFKAMIVTIGFYVTKKTADSLKVCSYWILAMILISPYGSTYTFILMLFPFLTVAKSELPVFKKAILFVLMFLVNNLPLSFFIENQFPLSYLRLMVLIAFFIFLAAYQFRPIDWKIVSAAAFAAMISVVILYKPHSSGSVYMLPKGSPLLIHDYQIKTGQLTYFYWDENGEGTRSFAFDAHFAFPIELRENQVFYNGKQLTFETSNKLKPMLIDDKTVVYLSDCDRGIGFYTLRKIALKPN